MKIRNWHKFQHFKDRRPPWIKLYRDLLDDMDWHELDPVAAKALVMVWLIASEDDGKLPELKKLAFRLRMTEQQTKQVLNKLAPWLEQTGNSTVSDCYQTDAPETETETETETDHCASQAKRESALSGFDDFWSAYPKKKNKGDAEKAWKALRPTDELKTQILAAVEVAKGSDGWRKDGGQFVPYPASWLRAKGWEDEVKPAAVVPIRPVSSPFAGAI